MKLFSQTAPDASGAEDLKALFREDARLPFRETFGDAAVEFWTSETRFLLETEAGFRLWLARDGSRIEAAAWGWPLVWASDYFGASMFLLDGFARRESVDEDGLAGFFSAVLESAAADGARHVSLQTLEGDGPAAVAAGRTGFQPAARTLTHVLARDRGPAAPADFPPPGECVDGYRDGDRDALIALAEETDIPSAFRSDPFLDPGRARAYYRRRVEQICDAGASGGLHVWRTGEKIAGFDAYGADPRLSRLMKGGVAFKMMTALAPDRRGRGEGGRFLDWVHHRLFETHSFIAGRIQADNAAMAGALRSIGARVVLSQRQFSLRIDR